MLAVTLGSIDEVAKTLAQRAKALRLARGWTQVEMAGRAGVKYSTYRRFERTGDISLRRLLRIAFVLDALGGFERVFREPAARSLEELERMDAREGRKRGRRRVAHA